MPIPVSLVMSSLAVFSSTLCCQTFEVASFKKAMPPSEQPNLYVMKGGGIGNNPPGQFVSKSAPLLALITRAYSVYSFRVAPSPGLESDRFDIVAKVPAGTTDLQARAMLRNLLVDRLGLVVHHEIREGPVYNLVIDNGGLKMKPARPAPVALATTDDLPVRDSAARPAVGSPTLILDAVDGSTMHITAHMQGMPDLIRMVEQQVGRAVLDKTELPGKFDFDFTFTRSNRAMEASGDIASDPAEDFISAIRSHLGLKLVSSKGPIDMLVVDRWNPLPTPN